jgi:tRNA pseudouridine38-40 synthase
MPEEPAFAGWKQPLDRQQAYLARFAFEGARYAGWQRQTNGVSIQETLEAAFEQVVGTPVKLRAAGRTDAGVHALDMPADFTAPFDFDLPVLLRAWNAVTPHDIAVLSIRRVRDGFSARRLAARRTYRYLIDNRRIPSPFHRRFAWHIPNELDVDAMRQAMAALIGEHDFSSFRATDCEAKHAVRRIDEAGVAAWPEANAAALGAWLPFPGGPAPGLLSFTVAGTAFLKHQVRAIVGTLVGVGRARISPAEFAAILAACDRRQAGPTAPAHGLTLVRVDFRPQALVD